MEGERLLAEGLERLRTIVGDGVEITPVERGAAEPQNPSLAAIADSAADALITVRDRRSGSVGDVLVEARQSLTPAQVRNVLTPKAVLMRRLTGDAALLVIAPWLSPRTRATLDEIGYGYLDLTGNVSLRLRRPTVVVRLAGATRDPYPSGRSPRQQLRGARAGRLVRVLVDVAPPYRGSDLAQAAGVSLSYVSRLLDALQEEALITRARRTVVDVNWPEVLRARAAQFSLLDANNYEAVLAPRGIAYTLDRVREERRAVEKHGPAAVTGSVAAAAIAPTTVGGQLALYVPQLLSERGPLNGVLRSGLGLVPSEVGANVLLLKARDPHVFARRREVDGLPHVALSQLVLDSLSGSGRMPAEGEAVLEYMIEHQADWRLPDLSNVVGPSS